MTGTDHVWRVRDGLVICASCGVVHSSRYIALRPCSGALGSAPHDGEQSSTSDEREIDRLRLEVAALTALADAREAEVDRLRRLVTAAAAALDGLLTDVDEQGFQVHSYVASHLRKMARALRGALDQGAPLERGRADNE